MIFLTRKFSFSAAHRYWDPHGTPEENSVLFGPEAEIHGHNYLCEVTIQGEVDPETGVVVHLTKFGNLLKSRVAVELDRKDLNQFPFFHERQTSPENIAIYIWERIEEEMNGFKLYRVRVEESPDLAAEYYGKQARLGILQSEREGEVVVG